MLQLNDVQENLFFIFFFFIEPHKKAWLAFFVVKSAMKIFWQLEKDIHKIRTQCVIHVINDCMLYCIRVSCIIVWRFYSGFFYVKKKISTQQKMNYECKTSIHTNTKHIEKVFIHITYFCYRDPLSFIGNHEWMNCIFSFDIYTGIYDQHSFT